MVFCCFRSIVNIILAQVYCTLKYVSDVAVKRFTFAISSPDELFVECAKIANSHCRNGDNFKTPVDNLFS